MSRRRERRTPMAMPIVMHQASAPATTPSSGCTLDLTSKGARVQLQSDWEAGELIWVERHGKRAQFRVVWVGEAGTAKQRQIGIECVEPEFDWGVPLAQEPDVMIDESEDPAPVATRQNTNHLPSRN